MTTAKEWVNRYDDARPELTEERVRAIQRDVLDHAIVRARAMGTHMEQDAPPEVEPALGAYRVAAALFLDSLELHDSR